MKICLLILLSFIIFFSENCSAQDTIWFLSGERLITSNYTIKTEDGMLNYFNKRNKEKHVGLEFVYSVNEKNGNKKVYYESSIMENMPFSVDQMGSFIKGEYEAHDNYHATGATVIGILTGAGGVYLSSLVVGTPFYSPVVPAIGSVIVGSTNKNADKIAEKYPQYANNEYFIMGYQEIANQKRISNSIKGGILGLVLGVASAIIISK